MALSSVPSGGPGIPSGAKRVSIKDVDTSSSNQKEDVTDLSSSKREYADPPLKDVSSGGVTRTCTASGQIKGTFSLSASPSSVKTGWICTQAEEVYEAGKFAQWSASWDYVPPSSPTP